MGNLQFGGTISSTNLPIAISGDNTAVDRTNRFVRVGVLSNGTGKLILQNAAVAKINGACTYTGNRELNLSELWIENGGSIASGSAIYVGNGGQLANASKLWLSNSTGGTTFSNNKVVWGGFYHTTIVSFHFQICRQAIVR